MLSTTTPPGLDEVAGDMDRVTLHADRVNVGAAALKAVAVERAGDARTQRRPDGPVVARDAVGLHGADRGEATADVENRAGWGALDGQRMHAEVRRGRCGLPMRGARLGDGQTGRGHEN